MSRRFRVQGLGSKINREPEWGTCRLLSSYMRLVSGFQAPFAWGGGNVALTCRPNSRDGLVCLLPQLRSSLRGHSVIADLKRITRSSSAAMSLSESRLWRSSSSLCCLCSDICVSCSTRVRGVIAATSASVANTVGWGVLLL